MIALQQIFFPGAALRQIWNTQSMPASAASCPEKKSFAECLIIIFLRLPFFGCFDEPLLLIYILTRVWGAVIFLRLPGATDNFWVALMNLY